MTNSSETERSGMFKIGISVCKQDSGCNQARTYILVSLFLKRTNKNI